MNKFSLKSLMRCGKTVPTVWLLFCLLSAPVKAAASDAMAGDDPVVLTNSQKGVRISGDVGAVLLPVAGLTAILINKDWEGLKQGALAGVTTLGVTTALKYIVKKERPDRSDFRSFPSMHTSVSFTAASFIQRRYGWKWGAPAYLLSAYVGWSRVYGKKHDWWDVATGAAIGVGSTYIYTRPFARKHNLVLAPVAGDGHYGFYASMNF